MGAIEEQLATHARAARRRRARAPTSVRENLRALEKVRGADDLRKKLLASLAQVTRDADALARALAADNEALAQARHKLADSLRDTRAA